MGGAPSAGRSSSGFTPTPEPPFPAGDPDASYATYVPPEPAAPRERMAAETSPPAPAEPSSEPRLVGTMRRGDDWRAWVVPPEEVEPIIVRQGGTLAGWEVVEIGRSTVTLRQDDSTMSLRMFEPPGEDAAMVHEDPPVEAEPAE